MQILSTDQMKKIPVIIDCDPGADDALGILLALHCPFLDVLGITAVFGNGPVEQMAGNAAKVCEFAGFAEIPVYTGAEQPLSRTMTFTEMYCGADGLCESGLEDGGTLISGQSAGEFLIETLKNAEEPVTVISTGGFTNLAAALTAAPEIRFGIREIVAASGYFGLNRSVSRAEWNIYVDPEAAKIVYESGIPIRAVGLDVTAQLEEAYLEAMLHGGAGRIHRFVTACAEYNGKNGFFPRSVLTDGMAVAAVIRPEIISCKAGKVTVHPEKKDAELMDFTVGEGGWVQAAWQFDFTAYIEMVKELVNL